MTFTTKVLRTADEICAMKDQWMALEKRSQGTHIFQSYDLSKHVLNLTGREHENAYYVICVLEADKLVGLLPLVVWHKKGRKILTGFSEPYQQYTEMLCDPDCDPKQVFEQMQSCFKDSGADYVHLGQVRHDGPLFAGCESCFDHSEEEKAAPFVDLTQWEDYDGYYNHLKRATRKRIRNGYNRFDRMGTLDHVHGNDPKLLVNVIDRSYEGRVDWQRRLGLTSRAFQDDTFREFLDRFKDSDDQNLKVAAFCFMLNGEPVADQWGFIYDDCYYAYMSTWDEEKATAGPGKLHLGEVIKSCYELGLKRVDFLIPSVQYKMVYATGEVEASDFIKPLNGKGYLYANIWLKQVRPKLKAIMQAMPAEQRKKIINTVFNRK